MRDVRREAEAEWKGSLQRRRQTDLRKVYGDWGQAAERE